mmetsp:Transcript_57478/g.171486  ORF Transcript_57478/g.171486 Transcript_57478/m.171486 type:complete len:201 (+) Transcript_57478:817-1419(+)
MLLLFDLSLNNLAASVCALIFHLCLSSPLSRLGGVIPLIPPLRIFFTFPLPFPGRPVVLGRHLLLLPLHFSHARLELCQPCHPLGLLPARVGVPQLPPPLHGSHLSAFVHLEATEGKALHSEAPDVNVHPRNERLEPRQLELPKLLHLLLDVELVPPHTVPVDPKTNEVCGAVPPLSHSQEGRPVGDARLELFRPQLNLA